MNYFDIIKASSGVPVDDPWAMLWAQNLSEDWPVTELTSELPLFFLSDGGALKNYRIYGTAGGAGVETENLCLPFTYQGVIQGVDGEYEYSTAYVSTEKFEINSAKLEFVAGMVGKTFRVWGVAFYNENDEFISMAQGQNASSIYAQIPANAKYAACTCSVNPSGQNTHPSDIINPYLIYGSTVPTSYIQPGYKIPILNTSGVTENILNQNETEQGDGYEPNKILTQYGTTMTTTWSWISEYINVIPGTDYCFFTDLFRSAVYAFVVFYSKNKTFVSSIVRKNFPNPIEYSQENCTLFTAPLNAYYMRIAIDRESTKNMLTSGSTPPDHFIPHRYETDYNLYIGDSKLGEEEYLEYRSKRADKLIYDRTSIDDASLRRVRMIIDAGNSTVLPAGITYATTGLIAYRGTECPELTRESAAARDDIYDYNLPAAQFQTTAKDTKGGIFYRGYAILSDGTLIYGDTVGCTLNEQATEIVETLRIVSTDIPLYPTIWKDDGEGNIVPTDPPAPLPAISTYKGENTLSSTETVGSVTVKGRIKEVSN